MSHPQNRAGRDEKAFTGPKGKPVGLVKEADCEDAGLHATATWNIVKTITVGDLMMLSGFHERKPPRRKLPDLKTPEGASIIRALENHTGMNYYATGHGGGEYEGIHACCTCIG